MGRPVNYKRSSLLLIILLLSFPIAGADPGEPPAALSPESTGDEANPFSIILFIPTTKMIHSDQILDQVTMPDNQGVLFGTSFGLSQYDGKWSTRHINRNNVSEGLLDDYIMAVEYDHEGNLWIGYSGGIQVYNGVYYRTIRDQQLLKDPRIHDLQRWNDDMWIATGNAGIHRYRNGAWTWFQPGSEEGPGFYEIHEMVLDPVSGSLIIATNDNGLWKVSSPDDPVVFEQIAPKFSAYGGLTNVRRDPQGGVFFFDDTTIVHYAPHGGFVPILTAGDLAAKSIAINDLSADSYGRLFIASDDGIYIWSNGQVQRHIGRYDGIGSSEVVRTVTLDADNRAWFSTSGYVGYYADQYSMEDVIPVDIYVPEDTPATGATQKPVGIPTLTALSDSENGEPDLIARVLQPIFSLIDSLFSLLGIGREA